MMKPLERAFGCLRVTAPGIDYPPPAEISIERAWMDWSPSAEHLQNRPFEFPQRHLRARVQKQLHVAWQKPVRVQIVFFDSERGISALEIAGVIFLHPMTKDQILSASRGAYGIGLNESEPVDGVLE